MLFLVWFGFGDEEIAPYEPVEVMLPYEKNGKVTCFDRAQIDPDRVIVDCVFRVAGVEPYDNLFYIGNRNEWGKISKIPMQTYYAFDKILSRKSLPYYTGDDTFLVSGVFFDNME